ncbi:hypothetical protein TcCL_Unassigned04959 [Trypanosoma cruzi]|nr:hypothetical protein TcCL_Unassigned04959 [Trypanosoma cruzi]
MNHLTAMQKQSHHHPRKTVILPIMKLTRALKRASRTMIQQLMVQGHEKKNKMKIKKPIRRKQCWPQTPQRVTPGDSDGSTAVSHTTSPLLLLVVACAAAAAVVAA